MIAQAAEQSRTLDVVVLDMRALTTVCDYFVIGHSRSATHLEAISRNIREQLAQHDVRPHHREGTKQGQWLVLDYLSVVVHLFNAEARRFYDLERLWADAAVVEHSENSLPDALT